MTGHQRRLLVALGITQITAWGSVYYLMSPLMTHLQRDLGLGKDTVVGAFSVALLMSGVLSPVIGRAIDRYGGRLIMSLGALGCGAGLLWLSQASGLASLYGAWLLLGASMAATLYDPAFAVLARAFHTDLRRAITLVTLFGGFASTVFWPLTQALIDAFGWRSAVGILALINLVLCLPLHLWAQRPLSGQGDAMVEEGAASGGAFNAAAASQRSALHHALRTPAFYLLCGAFMANALAFSAMSVHLLPMLVDKGLTPLQAAGIGALAGPMQVLGRIAEMTLARRYNALHVGFIALAMLPLSLLLFAALGPAIAPYWAFALLYGAGNGITTIVRGAIPAEIFGRTSYGAINGAMAAPVLIAKAGGPLVAAMLWVALGGYANIALILAAVAAISVLLIAALLARDGGL